MQSKGNVLNRKWHRKTSWLRYSFPKDAEYCSSCVVFVSKSSIDKTFVSTPVNDWSNIHNYIKQHEVLKRHLIVLILSPKRQRRSPLFQCYRLYQHKKDIVRNRHIVKEVIDVLILCGHQNIANRGHTENNGNSMVNLRHLSNYSLTWITQSLIRG